MNVEYVFGTRGRLEVLKTKGETHTDLAGYRQIRRSFAGGEVITDNFRVVRRLDRKTDPAGNCYDWYEIDRHYRTIDRSSPVAEEARRAAAAAGSAFVALAEAGAVDGAAAGAHAEIFPLWGADTAYPAGAIRRSGESLYRCIQAHTSQAGWEPENVPALWEALKQK